MSGICELEAIRYLNTCVHPPGASKEERRVLVSKVNLTWQVGCRETPASFESSYLHTDLRSCSHLAWERAALEQWAEHTVWCNRATFQNVELLIDLQQFERTSCPIVFLLADSVENVPFIPGQAHRDPIEQDSELLEKSICFEVARLFVDQLVAPLQLKPDNHNQIDRYSRFLRRGSKKLFLS